VTSSARWERERVRKKGAYGFSDGGGEGGKMVLVRTPDVQTVSTERGQTGGGEPNRKTTPRERGLAAVRVVCSKKGKVKKRNKRVNQQEPLARVFLCGLWGWCFGFWVVVAIFDTTLGDVGLAWDACS